MGISGRVIVLLCCLALVVGVGSSLAGDDKPREGRARGRTAGVPGLEAEALPFTFMSREEKAQRRRAAGATRDDGQAFRLGTSAGLEHDDAKLWFTGVQRAPCFDPNNNILRSGSELLIGGEAVLSLSGTEGDVLLVECSLYDFYGRKLAVEVAEERGAGKAASATGRSWSFSDFGDGSSTVSGSFDFVATIPDDGIYRYRMRVESVVCFGSCEVTR